MLRSFSLVSTYPYPLDADALRPHEHDLPGSLWSLLESAETSSDRPTWLDDDDEAERRGLLGFSRALNLRIEGAEFIVAEYDELIDRGHAGVADRLASCMMIRRDRFCTGCGTQRGAVTWRCGNRELCPACARAYRGRVSPALARAFAHLAGTCRGKHVEVSVRRWPGEDLLDYARRVTRLRGEVWRWLEKRCAARAAVANLEFGAQTMMAHFHMIVDCDFVPRPRLQQFVATRTARPNWRLRVKEILPYELIRAAEDERDRGVAECPVCRGYRSPACRANHRSGPANAAMRSWCDARDASWYVHVEALRGKSARVRGRSAARELAKYLVKFDALTPSQRVSLWESCRGLHRLQGYGAWSHVVRDALKDKGADEGPCACGRHETELDAPRVSVTDKLATDDDIPAIIADEWWRRGLLDSLSEAPNAPPVPFVTQGLADFAGA